MCCESSYLWCVEASTCLAKLRKRVACPLAVGDCAHVEGFILFMRDFCGIWVVRKRVGRSFVRRHGSNAKDTVSANDT